ncbi:glutathione synthetase-like [Porites lutea]|uniref:glutathione synthetase-like n=1 Tax=Porites lutea TaxID=51062 RepID=UPI003CC583D1
MSLAHIREHDISKEEVRFLESEGKDYCLSHGMIYKDKNENFQHIPFTLLPSPFPEKLFTAAREVQVDFNLLVHKVSQDYHFTKKALLSTVAADPFTSKLFDIYDTVWKQGISKPEQISLGIFRSDYLIDTTAGTQPDECNNYDHKAGNGDIADSIKQVEINTIALGGITFSCLVPNMHRYLLQLIGQHGCKVPANPALDEAAAGLIKAWELYGSASAVIMFVVEREEVNVYDQRLLEYHIKERNSAVCVIRRSLADVFRNGKTKSDQCLFVDGLEVAVVYYRAGYSPKHYPTEKEWEARLTMELARCVKCPSVGHQLIGTKKMQQVLAEPGVLERFLPDKDSVQRVRRTFTGLYTLDLGTEGDRNMKYCLQAVKKYVLKPQREGGGNNIYGEEIRRILLKTPESRSQFILMDRIQPKSNKNILVRQDTPVSECIDVIPELGIVGIIISRGDEILLNKEAGYLVRTKTMDQEDGGVFAGRAAFDSLFLM